MVKRMRLKPRTFQAVRWDGENVQEVREVIADAIEPGLILYPGETIQFVGPDALDCPVGDWLLRDEQNGWVHIMTDEDVSNSDFFEDAEDA